MPPERERRRRAGPSAAPSLRCLLKACHDQDSMRSRGPRRCPSSRRQPCWCVRPCTLAGPVRDGCAAKTYVYRTRYRELGQVCCDLLWLALCIAMGVRRADIKVFLCECQPRAPRPHGTRARDHTEAAMARCALPLDPSCLPTAAFSNCSPIAIAIGTRS
jgi:hypothetical protein